MTSEEINVKELSALVSLLEDDDREVANHVESKLLSLGTKVIPFLEKEWMNNSLIPYVRSKIEDIIHALQYELLREDLMSWKNERSEDLLEGMMLIAKYQYPDLNLDFLERKFEQFYQKAVLAFGEEAKPMEQVKVLNDFFYNELKFRPNSKNFHAPSNSMLNVVLESKRGNPLTLCVIYLLIARRLKMPVSGVNLPNLFILIYESDQTNFYVNVFNNGMIFTREDLDNYIEQLNIGKQDMFYEACSHVAIIARCLRNLLASFEKIGEYKRADDIKMLLQSVEESKY